jgi:alkyl hydroperoxide reductase subunit AhpF
MQTEIPGIYAAGDIRANSARQVVTAAGDGATAAIRADHYISERFGGQPGTGEWEPAVAPGARAEG